MSHHHHGFGCSCSNPMWKTLLPENASLLSHPPLYEKADIIDQIFYTVDGGTIITLEKGENIQVEAIAVKNGKIAMVGSYEQVKSECPEITIADHFKIEGKQTLLPSFIDPHTHIIPSAIMNIGMDLSPFSGQDLRTNVYNRKLIGEEKTDSWCEEDDYSQAWILKELQKCVDALNDDGDIPIPILDDEEKNWSIPSAILAHNVDPSLLIGDKEFNLEILDKVIDRAIYKVKDTSTDAPTAHPIYITNTSGHIAYINGAAIGKINKYNVANNATISTGTNGVLKEFDEMLPAFNVLFKNQVSKSDLMEKIQEQLKLIFDNAVKRGVTYLFDAGMDTSSSEKQKSQVALMEEISGEAFPVRLGGALLVSNLAQLKNDIIDKYQPNSGDEFFNIASLKLVSDGSAQGLTAYQYTPYDCDENYINFSLEDTEKSHEQTNTGLFNYGYPIELNELLTIANNYAWPVMVHANGDHAIDRCIGAFKAAGITEKTRELRRDRIEHCSLLTSEMLQDMQNLGISPSFTIGHVGYWGWLFKYSAIGQERANQLDLCRSALNDYDMRITFHSDYGVTPLGSLRMMEQSITRVMEGAPYIDHKKQIHEVLNESETITPFQALKAVTYDAAWQCHADQWVGSLEVNKCADFVIMAKSPLTYQNGDTPSPAQGMRDIPILSTWKGGRRVYSKSD